MLGANRSMLQLILELRDRGVDSTVLIPYTKGNNELEEELKRHSIKVISGSFRCIKHSIWWKVLINYIYAEFLQYKLLRNLEDYKFDIIHSNSSIINLGKRIARRLKSRHVWHLREFGDKDYKLKTPFGKWFQKVIYGGENDYIAISDKIYKHYSKYIDSNKLHLIYNGIKVPQCYIKSTNNILQFCIVGVISPQKGQIDVLFAANELLNIRKITEFHISIIGQGSIEYENRLKSYVEANHLSGFVDFVGYQSDVNKLLKGMDVGIMASANEAFGRVTIEYMMNRLAVIASDGGANKEIVQDKLTGLIYPVGEYIALADKMESLIKDPKSAKRLAEQGREWAAVNFSSRTNAENIIRLYMEILNLSQNEQH